MRNLRNLRSFFLLSFLFATGPAIAAGDAEHLDAIVQPYVAEHQFMGSVLVQRDQTVLLNKGYGSANLEWGIPNTPTTRFRLGSVTKQFTAAAVLLLEQRGKLKLDDPVSKYMPDAPAAWSKVTLFHLLTHTAGVPNYPTLPDYDDKKGRPATPEELIGWFKDMPLEFEPGEYWTYSNSGYAVLGHVIERVSGQSYAAFLRDNIFKPLGMNDSDYDMAAPVMLRRASGYVPSEEGVENAGYVDMSVPYAAGALLSTTEDLQRWTSGLFSGKLLSPASLKKMTTPYQNDYALGVFSYTTNGHKVVSHPGGIDGFNTQLSYFPDERLTIVVLGNLNGRAPKEIFKRLASAVYGENLVLAAERKVVPVPKETLAQYVGSYKTESGALIRFELSSGKPMVKLAKQAALPVFSESQTVFFFKAIEAQIEFFKDEKGSVSHLVLSQDGKITEAKRIGIPAFAGITTS